MSVNNPINKVSIADIEKLLQISASTYLVERIRSKELNYTNLSELDQQKLISFVIRKLIDGDFVKAGEDRKEEWELGWGENFAELTDTANFQKAITPKYFNKYNVVRWGGSFIQPVSENFEKNTLSIIVDYISDKYFREMHSIYEFGCGTGHNLFSVRAANEKANLYGLDWATSSQKIIESVRLAGIDSKMYGYNFDYFNPDYSIKIQPKSAVYTVASLEQVGNRWVDFVEYLIANTPDICVHIEPIAEVLDENVVMDCLSIEYFKKRNYLNGFLSGLKRLEGDGRVEIMDVKRTHIGSLFIEGYTIVVWRPVSN